MPVIKKKKQEEVKSSSKSNKSKDKGDASMSKAQAFDNAKVAGTVPAGKYEAIIDSIVLQKPDDKGQSSRITFKIASEGDAQGSTVPQWSKLFDENEEPQRGLEFLKKDLAILGYPDVKFAELEDVFEEITNKHLGVVITVKHKDGFVNCYIQGLAEGSEVIAEFLANNPY